MSRILGMIAVALAAIAGPMAAQAQTLPRITSFGPDFPKTGIFIGNSFFYYNNGLPGHLSLMEKAADPEHKHDRLFDVAIMMDCSQCPIHPKLKSVFTDYAKKNSVIVRAKGAKPAFFM